MPQDLKISVVGGDVLHFDADVLVVKFAQALHGVDRAVVQCVVQDLATAGLPLPGAHLLVGASPALLARRVLVIGVDRIVSFGYAEIRDFARRALTVLASAEPGAAHIAFTIHGVGYGLDERESLESEVAGILDAIGAGAYPPALARISIVEADGNRVDRLKRVLERLVPGGRVATGQGAVLSSLPADAQTSLRAVGYGSASKPHIFVAMPFAPEFDDIFYYGIQGAIKEAGFLCERADLASFTGDVLAWVKARISTARMVVADLSSANPNVYLEVGFAWALRIPTILVVADEAHLKFDVRSQRCLVYKSIRNLEELLGRELRSLAAPAGAVPAS